jgi:hypothetical protein
MRSVVRQLESTLAQPTGAEFFSARPPRGPRRCGWWRRGVQRTRPTGDGVRQRAVLAS